MMMFANVLFWISSSLLFLSFVDAQRYGDLRLARLSYSSSTYSSGRLEIYIGGRWGTVCDDSFGFTDANVACRQLGYSGASSSPVTASTRSLFASGTGTIWLDNVGCSGTESCLLSCSNRGLAIHDCSHFEDVAIYCSTSGTRSSSTDCSSGSTTCASSQFRCDSGQCISSAYRCNGATGGCNDGSDERGCSCTSSQFRCDNGQCTSSSNRCNGVSGGCSDGSDERGCSQTFTNGNLRLARGSLSLSSYSSGRLEIYINGRWGTVCDDSFGFTDADVACRQLGYSGASSSPVTASSRSSFGSGSGTIWLDNVGCSGSETCLLSCYNRGIGVENCVHSEDVAIYCSGSRASSTDCSSTGTQGVDTGGVVGGALVALLVILCLIGAVPSSICYLIKSSKRNQRTIAPVTLAATNPSATLAAPHPTATPFATTTSSETKPGASYPGTSYPGTSYPGTSYPGTSYPGTSYPGKSYPTGGVSPYPSQPPPQPGTSPAKPTAYPEKSQELPPPYPGQAFEMQPILNPAAGPYPPQPAAAYPPQTQAVYPPAAGYPEQTAPDPAQASRPIYPAAPPSTDPDQPAPSPTDLNRENTPQQ